MHEKKHKCTAQICLFCFLFFVIITYMHTKTPHTCKHTKDIIIQTSSQWCYKQMKGQRRIMRVGKQSCTDSGVHLGRNTAFFRHHYYSITHYFMKNLMRIGWSEGWREMPGWKRQQGKGWGDRASMREDRSFQLSVRMTVFNCVCACMCALSDVHSWMFICASMQTKSLADMDFLRTICFSVCTVFVWA